MRLLVESLARPSVLALTLPPSDPSSIQIMLQQLVEEGASLSQHVRYSTIHLDPAPEEAQIAK